MDKLLEWIKNHKILTGLIATLTCAWIVFVVLVCMNKNYIEFSVADSTTIELEYGSGEQLEPVTALFRGTIFNKKGISVEVSVEGQVEYDKLGDYEISYSAKYKKVTGTATIHAVVKDTTAPEITLVSNPEHYTSPVGTYEEEGFTAIDNHDGDVTAQVTKEEKDGKVTYRVTDSSGNEAVVERTIVYKDVIPPVISLKGKQNFAMLVGGSYSEAGFSATDECDGDITTNVVVEGSVNPNEAGTYTVTYRVSDSSGNVSEVQRIIEVKHIVPGDKEIYLTFDDGPCAYTERLLDILDRYNVKATFFVTGGYPDYYHMIGEAYRRGHTIAIHTFSHRYNEIYTSVDAYFEDLNRIKDIIIEQTGEEPWLVRFPGGTNNTVSRKYCPGIMSELAQELPNRGYSYCDWNVVSGDAGEVSTEQAVINNVINRCSGKKMSIVLQHDIKSFSVNAVDDIIEWGLMNGYTFKAMDETTPLIQNAPNN